MNVRRPMSGRHPVDLRVRRRGLVMVGTGPMHRLALTDDGVPMTGAR